MLQAKWTAELLLLSSGSQVVVSIGFEPGQLKSGNASSLPVDLTTTMQTTRRFRTPTSLHSLHADVTNLGVTVISFSVDFASPYVAKSPPRPMRPSSEPEVSFRREATSSSSLSADDNARALSSSVDRPPGGVRRLLPPFWFSATSVPRQSPMPFDSQNPSPCSSMLIIDPCSASGWMSLSPGQVNRDLQGRCSAGLASGVHST
jgi:hypothetical protein